MVLGVIKEFRKVSRNFVVDTPWLPKFREAEVAELDKKILNFSGFDRLDQTTYINNNCVYS